VQWDKGRAVLWLLERLRLDRPEVLPIYIGDDETDEDAFAALEDRGVGIRVGDGSVATRARYRLADAESVGQLLRWMSKRLSESEAPHG
jgi:trehalose-phosphatase